MMKTISKQSRIYRATALLLSVIMLLCIWPVADVGAYGEVNSDGCWYTWGEIQSTIDRTSLLNTYGCPVAAGYVDDLYAVNVNSGLNKVYKTNMTIISDYALLANGKLPDGTMLSTCQGMNFWSTKSKQMVFTGFKCPEGINRTAVNLNDIIVWRGGDSYTGDTYYKQWSLLRELARGENSGDIASTCSKFTTKAGGASIGFIMNTTGTQSGVCVASDTTGKFSVGLVPDEDFVQVVSNTNLNWHMNAYAGVLGAAKGIYVVFGSTVASNSSYNVYKVFRDGETITEGILDGWVEGYSFAADGSDSYRLGFERTGGSAELDAVGSYTLYLETGNGKIILADGVEINNDTDYRYYISYATPAYSALSPENSGYVITDVSTCGGRTAANSFNGGDHAWDDGVAVGTLGNRSRIYTCTCPGCGCTRSEKLEGDGHEHLWSEWEITSEPSCTQGGIESRRCLQCGEIENITSPALGHSYGEWNVISSPTCTQNGVRARVCIRCADTENESIPTTSHSYGEWEVTTAPTCAIEGVRTRTCIYCGIAETRSMPKTAHDYGEWSIVTQPTCHLKGVRTSVCKNCGLGKAENIPAMGHSYSEWVMTQEPTCTAPGRHEKTCANCGDVKGEYVNANGHSYGEWNVTTAPTATAEGEKTRVCSVCGYTEALAVAADSYPHAVTENYTLTVEEATGLTAIRIAPGVYNTAKEIKSAAGLVTFATSEITKRTENGVFRYELAGEGDYSIWLRYGSNEEYIKHVKVDKMCPTVTTNGVFATIHNLGGVSDFIIAKGHYTKYRDVSNNKIVLISTNRIGTSHDFTYGAPLPGAGEYTVWIRYKDSTRDAVCIHFPCVVTEPTFTVNGILITAGNIADARVIRIAPGEWNTPGEIKRAAGCRNFTTKQFGSSDSYTIQNSKSAVGVYSISVEYNNGYSVVYHFTPEHKAPTLKNTGATVLIEGLVGALYVRYAPGEYTDSAALKAADGVVTVRENDIIGYKLELPADSVYTFLVQYDDNSTYMYTTEAVSGLASQPITVSKVFSDDMVVQRDKPFSVWGWADPSDAGRLVKVTFRGVTDYAVIEDNGDWKLTFENVFTESTAFETIAVEGGANTVTFNRVLTGDIYYMMGQSNAYLPIGYVIASRAEEGASIDFYDFDATRNIRFIRNASEYYECMPDVFAQGTDVCYTDVFAPVKWYNAGHPSILEFSAIGYLLAFNLSNTMTVPVGVIEIDAPGYPIMAFAPGELNDRWQSDFLDAETGRHYAKIYDTAPEAQGQLLPSRFAYNQQLNPFMNLSCAGIVWYQGESDYANTIYQNGKEQYTYTSEFVELMEYYRSHMGNSDIPVYIVEFPSCYRGSENSNAFIDFGVIRSEIGMIPTLLDDCYIIGAADMWGRDKQDYYNSLHPYCKPEQALRLFTAVLNTKYNLGTPINYALGPSIKSVTYPDPYTVVMKFNYVGDGLVYHDMQGLGLMRGFEVLIDPDSYSEGWHLIDNGVVTAPDEITIRAAVPIYGVRYHAQTEFCYPYDVNVSNSSYIPMVAFADYKN